MLGTVIGAIASGRVPVGNAAGDLVTSWVNPTSILAGCLAVVTGAFLAAVYLAADARRLDEAWLADAFRLRALIAGAVAGGLAIAGLIVEDHDARRIYHGLTTGWGLTAVIISAIAGLTSLGLTWARRYSAARASAALAVAAILFGWAAAQRPDVLPGLTLSAAAASDSTMIAVIISVALGGVILFPSLGLLFRLSLAGRFDPAAIRRQAPPVGPDAPRPAWSARVAIAALLVGIGLLTIADASIAHIFGIAALVVAGLAGFAAIGPDELAQRDTPLDASDGQRSAARRSSPGGA
jgi:cytochrome d ubiquinol oxidase subunit II